MNRTVSLGLLDRVRVASPCPMEWNDMQPVGDGERVRHCDQCRLHVHNFSAMTRAEVEALLVNTKGRLCGAFYRRADGTILTRDCPVGLAAVRARAARAASRLAAGLALILSGSVLLGARGRGPSLRGMQPFVTIVRWLNPQTVATPPAQMQLIKGDICVIPPPTVAPAPGN